MAVTAPASGGTIRSGETSLEAAARRHHERKRREASFSSSDTLKDEDINQTISEKPSRDSTLETAETKPKSFADRWRKV